MHRSMTVAVVAVIAAATASYATPPAANTSTVANPTENPDEVVCRRVLVTGSLVQRVRVCKTRAEWDRGRDGARGAGKSKA